MSQRGLICNGVVISPNAPEVVRTVVVEGERIADVLDAQAKLPAADWVVDARGAWVMPGFIDVHTHGAAGWDVCDGSAEGLAAIAEAKLREGCTQFSPTTLTLPEADLARALRCVAAYDGRFSRVFGVHLEGPFISCECMGAQNPAFVRDPDFAEVARLNAIAEVAYVTFAAEGKGGVEFAHQLKQAGIIGTGGHSKASYREFVAAYEAGLRHLTHFCNQMSPLHHRDIGLVGAGFLRDDVMVELICDGVHLCREMIQLIFKCKPIESIELITDSMRASHLPEGASSIGGLEVLVRNGEARLASNGSLAGSVLKMNLALKNVHEFTGLPLNQLIQTTSWNQARERGMGGLFGKIEPGYCADLSVLEQGTFDVRAVVCSGVVKF